MENEFIYSKQKILDLCKIPHSQFDKLIEIYNIPFKEKESKMKVKSKYYTEETLNFIRELKDSNKIKDILKEYRSKNDSFQILQNYKKENNLYSQNELIKIWKTQNRKFWIEQFNLKTIEYKICNNRISYLYRKEDVDEVSEFLKNLEKEYNHPQSARQSYKMKIEKGVN